MKVLKALLTAALLLVNSAAFAADPAALDLSCNQGEDCLTTLIFKAAGVPVNLTGFAFRAQVRGTFTDTAALADFIVDTATAANGEVVLKLPAAVTAQLAGKSSVWDLRQTDPSGTMTYVLRGKFKCYWSATR